ncbi:helix-turn-helix domain-containing protein [Roseomonas alkaliterrae]|uniref:IclR family pca regulon transcriptional regulator n=1 Tax=Neoroseomonas alkaliterrae TaxID=1452450 RepID=A0A840XKE0_9PROT|nr:IclR family transcriptional regulator C-terminal domain-containing protein [Neoroseomonas alkaliterrae]MBB5689065.1 IclR family pca regulon transcriptional regulator [Neoroseomonas alkaliterrae]MBR0674610.1 helix-turn-helix domain-containing protein [Neoroseomonas alkaliterrae]
MRSRAENPKNLVQSVAKAFAVLRAFGPDLPELTVSEVAARTGHDRGTAFRLIHTLVGLGYLRAVPGGRRFRLTLKCLELGYAALSASDLPSHAQPLLRELVPEVADAGSLGVLEKGEVIYLARVEAGLERHGVVRRPGTRIGAYATALGQAILAWLPREEQVAQLECVPRVKLSDRTLTDLDALLARLDEVRQQGYAVSDGENAYGLRTVAAPVLDARGAPAAGVSLTIGGGRLPLADFVSLTAPRVRALAEELGTALRLSLGTIRSGGASE